MTFRPYFAFAAGAAAVLLLSATFAPRSAVAPQDPEQMKAMMEKAKRFTQPGELHKVLERFVGKWNTETRMFAGDRAMPPEKGTAEGSWLMPGRWLRFTGSGQMMRQHVETFHVIGYDNFKMSFVMTGVSSMDTAMLRAEGDLTPDGKALITYGTLDEYLTGEHDKMVRYVFRFLDENKMVFEVHDLPIGETNTKVVEVTYTRA